MPHVRCQTAIGGPAVAGLRLARSRLTVPIKRSPRKTPLPKTCFANGLKRATCESRKIPRFSAKNARCLAPLSMRAAVLCLKMTAFFRSQARCETAIDGAHSSQNLLILAPFGAGLRLLDVPCSPAFQASGLPSGKRAPKFELYWIPATEKLKTF